MTLTSRTLFGTAFGALIIATGLAAAPSPARRPAALPQPAATDRFFETQVRPILAANCFACHGGGAKPMGGLDLTKRAGLLKGGVSGPAFSPDKPGESLLLRAVQYQGPQMPPKGRLPKSQLDVLTRWIELGAPWGKEDASASVSGAAPAAHTPPKVNAETMRFWSFQPVKRPALPKVKNRAWVRTPVDAFVLAKLEAKGLQPNPPADPRTLIRRATYDLTGLPPTPEEVQAFVKECGEEVKSRKLEVRRAGGTGSSSSSNRTLSSQLSTLNSASAYDRLIDRLLASPHYGEKWGRHWLDLVRYAESNSYERDGTKPFAWRYRDYVIRSFNEDKPYDRFLTEQLAGDELSPRTSEGMIATGYYRLGIWDDEPVDPEQALYDDLDDIVSTTGQLFLGMTVGCARCHDHKIDPIPQKDYYSFLAFFSGLQRFGVRSAESVAQYSLRSIASGEEQEKHRAILAAHQEKVKANQAQIDAIESRVLPDLTPLEKEEWQTEAARLPIVRLRVPKLLTQEEVDRYRSLLFERRRLAREAPASAAMALCVTEVGPQPRDTYVLLRGNPHVRGDQVAPAFPSVLAPPAPQLAPSPHGDTSGRRRALARWLASPQNPLTARVMVNRVWQYHFGHGLVRSTSNFGFQGDPPTHPALLDWLAATFVSGRVDEWTNGRGGVAVPSSSTQSPTPWTLKHLHRLLMLSNAYRMASTANRVALSQDPENDLFWRFDMRRLGAEEIRDSIMAANGSLNPEIGGPSIYPTIPPEVLAGQSRPGDGWGTSPPEQQRRRSVYIFVKRSLTHPLIAQFDGPETDFSCPVRFATTQPTQALGMLNSTFLNEEAKVFAAYLRQHAGARPADQVTLALWRVLQRPPTQAEVQRGVRLIESLQAAEKATPEAALTQFCVVALNLNEFLYLD